MKKTILSFLVFTGIFSFANAQVSMSPNNGNPGQSLPIIISGQSGNWSSQGSSSLILSQGSYTISSVSNISVVNGSSISAHLSIPTNAPQGAYDLFLSAGTSTTQQQAFYVNPGTPSTMSNTPAGAKPSDNLNIVVSVSGAGFKTASQGIHSAWLSHGTEIIELSNIAVLAADSFSADVAIPAGATQGKWNINVYSNSEVMYYASETFEVDQSFSLTEGFYNFDLELYPNPGSEKLNISFDKSVGNNLVFSIFDISGRHINANLTELEPLSGKAAIDISELPKGVYFLQMTLDGEVLETRKWVKG